VINKEGFYTGIYHDYFLPLPLLYPKSKVLVIGLGGGTIPFLIKRMYGERVSVDVVEPERRMIPAAKKFLKLKKLNFKVIVGDGFKYVKSVSSRYDIIVLDAFIDDKIPKQFLGHEFIETASRALRKDGVLAINYAPNYIFMYLYLYRLRRFFRTYRIRNMLFGNYILICSKTMDKKGIGDAIRASKTLLGEKGRFLIKAYSRL
jgi:spermidine synthase